MSKRSEFTIEDIHMTNRHEKMLNIICSQENFKVKDKLDTTTHIWLKLKKKLTVLNADNIKMEQHEFYKMGMSHWSESVVLGELNTLPQYSAVMPLKL